MSVVGVASVVYGVDDLDEATRYYEDVGVPLTERTPASSTFTLEEGSTVVLRRDGDAALPDPWFEGPGVRETIFGVDTAEALDELVSGLARDRDVRRSEDGVAHFTGDDGVPYGLRVYRRLPVNYSPDPVNAPSRIHRLNQSRKWRTRARPKVISHVVFRVPDAEESFRFFAERLRFRLSDISRGLGFFARADGAPEHHTIFLLQNGFLDASEQPGFHHVCLGVEDIDELLVGANHMQRCGWRTDIGLGRHRIASSLFYYLYAPCGGMVEYGADTDYLDDSWVPRIWAPDFGVASVMAELPPFMAERAAWDVEFIEDYRPGDAGPFVASEPPGAPS